MLKKSIRSLKDKYIVNIVAAFFWNGDYKFVLNGKVTMDTCFLKTF